MTYPFQQTNFESHFVRKFDETVSEMELVWHKDENDREIEILKSDKWQLQMDNKLPIELKENHKIFIPKHCYHRIIKGNKDLMLKIKEN